nr:multiple epidermal growth factor-like domains protein 8 isoform X1 [Onthophagus taurus]
MRIISISLSGILVCLFILVGYAAVDLQPCDKSRRVFTDTWGVITDGPVGFNYTQDSHCEWLIKANGSSKFITLSFRSMGTECSYDYVFVYDGDSFKSPLLGSFSGKTEPQKVIAKSGYMLILLYSDTNYVLDGFRAEYSITDCPNNCTNNGFCNKYTNHCVCGSNFGGFDCSKKLCPDDCGQKEGKGICLDGFCKCSPHYSGQSCSLFEYDDDGNKWHWLSYSENGLSQRAAHSAVYVQATDSLYVFGGYNLNEVISSLEVYSFKNSTWTDELGKELPDRKLYKPIVLGTIRQLLEIANDPWLKDWGINKQKSSFFSNYIYSLNENLGNRRTQRHSQHPRGQKPAARYGHAACEVDEGFLIFGGKLHNGSLANDLWLFNVFTKHWELRAQLSDIRPPPLTRHTLTRAGDTIYLFGGGTASGEFSSKLFSISLLPDRSEEWQEVKYRGGKELDVRIVAHTTVYHAATNSLLVYGGIVAGIARFSKLSDRMYSFQLNHRQWTEIHYAREYLRESFVPRERAFHTANIMGNYLVVFGGYSHRHNKEEICYDNLMYLYHLGCHIWVNPEILGKAKDSKYPKQQGVFAHASSVRNGNTLLLIGGYHGNINGDLLAYTVPPMISTRTNEFYDPDTICGRHKNNAECIKDPECGWCLADASCYGRTVGANCTTNLLTTRCLGVCPALLDCRSCLIHGLLYQNAKHLVSAAYKLGLAECTWCVQNARCHHKDDYGVCGLREDRPGWWGTKGTEVVKPEECNKLDERPGLTFIKYYHPVNFSQPDIVDIINATTADLSSPSGHLLKTVDGSMMGRMLGFLRPPNEWDEKLKVCVASCNATLKIGDDLVSSISSIYRKVCMPKNWPEDVSSDRVSIDFLAQRVISSFSSHQQVGMMHLQHYKENEENQPKFFRFEYLEPYSNGSCLQYTNCQHCLTDASCGWCELSNQCVSRELDETKSCVIEDDWRYLTLQPSECSNCSNFISCESCTGSGFCEWWIEEAKCARIGSFQDAATNPELCPTPCYKRPDCSSCLQEKGRCVWCEATQQCFSFSVYTSEYQFGMCREWLDQAFPLVTNQESNFQQTTKLQDQCKSCSHHVNCTNCLSSLSCGWCYNSSNPINGVCVQGDFNTPTVNCSTQLGITNARWAYAQCPDVDECHLGLHDCHPEAICTNTDGSFDCICKRGYLGDGRTSCVKTCYNTCVHGSCSGEPDYTCKCSIGWMGPDCSINCECNNHSYCPKGVGICEACQNWTEGEHCDFCKAGSYGNATTDQGCHKCECNGHGNISKGECDIQTGVCFCQDNTEGDRCERCKANYYGDPRYGKQCYYQCEARGMLKSSEGQGISSRKSYNTSREPPPRECLWIINPRVEFGSAIIQLQVNASDLNVTCGENAVYVYDGFAELTDMSNQNALAAAYCSEDALPTSIVESKTGHLTVHYKQGTFGEGFNAIYKVIHCGQCQYPRRCKNGQCICDEGRVGPNCEQIICPDDCHSGEGRGICDINYGRCLCNKDYGGTSCDVSLNGTQLVFTELFNTVHLADTLEHLRKTLPRFGHSLLSDRSSLWMFGGYSLSHGPLNDIRLFDTRNSTWVQVTVDSPPDAKMPHGRYFHAADLVNSKQSIYIYGGISMNKRRKRFFNVNNRTLNDLWQFDIENKRWGEVEKRGAWPPGLLGHSLTYYKNGTLESLILIGGVSPQFGFSSDVWEFKLDKEVWVKWDDVKGMGPWGIFGHTTVFNSQLNFLYIFGGYEYHRKQLMVTNNLYVLNYSTRTWINLFGYSMENNLPNPRFLHSAVTTENYMFIYGGKSISGDQKFFAYSYNCNQWINLMSSSISKIGDLPIQTYAQAMTIELDRNLAYIIGGWGTDTESTVTQITLPSDFCSLWSNKSCIYIPDCKYCALKNDTSILSESCYWKSKQCPFGNYVNITKIENSGRNCSGPLTDCESLKDCGACLTLQNCQWCNNNCTDKTTSSCSGHKTTSPDECPSETCRAANCIQCYQLENCDWINSQCTQTLKSSKLTVASCPQPCSDYKTCSDCLDNREGDCRWSTQLDECISSTYQPIYCAGGVCGLVLEKKDDHKCPEKCPSFRQCSACLTHSHCGWCAAPGIMGEGVCVDSNKKSCETIFDDDSLKTFNLDRNITYSWHYVRCPKEDECKSGHHSCNNISEICYDKEKGFDCRCGIGYNLSSSGECVPLCSQGCVWGKCVEPDKCVCNFGIVGSNCSIPCQCNGHANCEGPDKLDKCLDCYNNTMGSQCEKCKPSFVRDPQDSIKCIPCTEYCHGHSATCVPENMTEVDLTIVLNEGPSGPAKCLNCANLTAGTRCDDCIRGNFRPPPNNYSHPCRPCECHGHGDNCDSRTGENCNCKNNTVSEECSTDNGRNSAQQCWTVQCSRCKEDYTGNPKEGRQCYKQLTVMGKIGFDSSTIDQTKDQRKPLYPGEMLFLMVSPRFANLDIRANFDVTQGMLDVFLSTSDDAFKAVVNSSTGLNEITFNPPYKVGENITKNGEHLIIREASGLRTYVTVDKPKPILHVKGVTDRLVIILPQVRATKARQNMHEIKFYFIIRVSDQIDKEDKRAFGLVYFQQDQLHIDLFVFFSVFFSCFFLFLAACVVAWKAKQAADVRRARRRQVSEMLHMAKRPFAKVTINLTSRPRIRSWLPYDVRPVAVEPTGDGLAAVITVFISYPGGQSPPVRLAMASALILHDKHSVTSGRVFTRRRSAHGVPQL